MTGDRVREVVEDLERTLQDFIAKHAINHAEYRRAIETIVDSVKAGEESLLFDVFLEAVAVDVGNEWQDGSPAAIEGPFYLPGAPKLAAPHRLPQRPDEAGDVLIFSGRVSDTEGVPLAEAELDVWQADASGLYSNVFPDIPDWNLRGRFSTSQDGGFEVETIVPPPYEIPKNGPTGAVLTAIGRHLYRPAHLHVKVRHPGHHELTAQLYFRGDRYLDNDVANAVRGGLVVDLVDDPLGRGVSARYDFVLASAN